MPGCPPPGMPGFPGGAPPGMPGGPPLLPAGRFLGKVKSYNEEKGFGFIECNETYKEHGRDVFIHGKQLGDFSEGIEVMFSCDLNKDGKPQARDVTLPDGTHPGKSSRSFPDKRDRGGDDDRDRKRDHDGKGHGKDKGKGHWNGGDHDRGDRGKDRGGKDKGKKGGKGKDKGGKDKGGKGGGGGTVPMVVPPRFPGGGTVPPILPPPGSSDALIPALSKSASLGAPSNGGDWKSDSNSGGDWKSSW